MRVASEPNPQNTVADVGAQLGRACAVRLGRTDLNIVALDELDFALGNNGKTGDRRRNLVRFRSLSRVGGKLCTSAADQGSDDCY